jgi:hypothetical protein
MNPIQTCYRLSRSQIIPQTYLSYSNPVPKHPNPTFHKVVDHIRVSMHGGKIVDAIVKAILDDFTDGPRYQVDFGHDQTALIGEWQIVKD